MLTERFDYKQLKRKNVNGKRHYMLAEDIESTPVPSVTTILSETKPKEDAEALKRWRRNVGHVRAKQISTESANRGTRMHRYLEEFCNTGDMPTPGSNPYAQHANGMAVTIAQKGFEVVDEVWGTEIPLYFPKIYAGTTDCAGIHNKSEAIIDFKQTNKLKKREWITDYFLQLAAYAEAHNELYGTNIRKGVIMMCSQNWEYQEFIIEGKEYEKYRKEWWKRVEQFYTTIKP